jgi:hypothetical protein
MYNKQVGTTSLVPYPILLKNTIKYFDTIQTDASASSMNNNFIFITPSQQPMATMEWIACGSPF